MSWVKDLSSSRNLRLVLALILSVLVTLTACENPPAPAPSPSSYPSPTSYLTPTVSPYTQSDTARPVMQVSQGCGMVPCTVGITNLIMWDDGQVVFESNRVFFETHLDTARVADIIDAASFLYDLDDYVSALSAAVFDASSVWLTVEAEQGHRKTVEVYGWVIESQVRSGIVQICPCPPEVTPLVLSIDLSKKEILERLQSFWEMVKDSLPEEPFVMRPAEVLVQLSPSYGGNLVVEALPKWSSALIGNLYGHEAEEAIRMGGLGYERAYNVGGQAQYVRIVPVLPSIHIYN